MIRRTSPVHSLHDGENGVHAPLHDRRNDDDDDDGGIDNDDGHDDNADGLYHPRSSWNPHICAFTARSLLRVQPELPRLAQHICRRPRQALPRH